MARTVRGPASALLALLCVLQPHAVGAQSPPFSSTLRYGSGYFDIPAAAVLPNMGLRAAWSGFWVRSDGDPLLDGAGQVSDAGEPRRSFHGDASFSLGIMGRGELGASLQSFSSGDDGGRMLGAFGKLLLLDPSDSGLGVAVGARYLSRPDFGDGQAYVPGRLGFPDQRLREDYAGAGGPDTRLSLYGAATLQLEGPRASWLPENDVTLTLGYGSGMFREGGDLSWYAPPGWNGWFLAGGMDLSLAPGTILALAAEHNGFDVNLGLEIVHGGASLGAHVLGANHAEATSPWRSRKLGISVSLTACPLLKRACRPGLRTRAPADTVRLPAPPPDTVRRAPPTRDTAKVSSSGVQVVDRRTGEAASRPSPEAQWTAFSRTRFRASRTAMADPRLSSSSSHALAPRSL